MATVMVELTRRPVEPDDIEFVDDLDDVLESNRCACSAGDDQPY